MLCAANTRFCLLALAFACQPFPLPSNPPRRRLLPLPCPNEGVSGWRAEAAGRGEASPLHAGLGQNSGFGPHPQPARTRPKPNLPCQNLGFVPALATTKPAFIVQHNARFQGAPCSLGGHWPLRWTAVHKFTSRQPRLLLTTCPAAGQPDTTSPTPRRASNTTSLPPAPRLRPDALPAALCWPTCPLEMCRSCLWPACAWRFDPLPRPPCCARPKCNFVFLSVPSPASPPRFLQTNHAAACFRSLAPTCASAAGAGLAVSPLPTLTLAGSRADFGSDQPPSAACVVGPPV